MLVPLKHGILQVQVEQTEGRSIISSLRQRTPLRASSPLYPADSGTVCFYIMNPAAGLLQGDQHNISVRVKSDAHAVIFGQGATKVFRAPQSNPSRQFTTLIVEPGARLEYMPEVVIPFAESCLFSRTNLLISSKSSAFLWEITAPGRVARQELFAYKSFDQQTNIWLDCELIYSDRFLLEPEKVPTYLQTWQQPLGMMHGYSHMGTFWVIEPKLESEMFILLRRQADEESCYLEQIAEQHKVLINGTALCKQAYCFRALAHSKENIQNVFRELWRVLRLRLYNEPDWPWRKY
jgi:urease accessory protein